MSELSINWPPEVSISEGCRVILATQGIRLWTAECLVLNRGDALQLICSDKTTLDNLRRQSRVAFSVVDPNLDATIQGSGIARVEGEADAQGVRIALEPYRLAVGQERTYELKLNGWMEVTEVSPPDLRSVGFWYQAFRAVTLTLSVIPVLMGAAAAFAQGQFDPGLLILAAIGGALAHAGANAFADYFDFKKGVDSSRALSSHLGALARERVAPEWILLAAFACFSATALIGIVLVQRTGWPLMLFGLVGLLGAFSYTGWPVAYKYRAMGEPLLGVLMGPLMVMGSYYLQTRGWDWALFLLSLAVASIVASISRVNNLRDLPDDQMAGIRTLPMALGVTGTKRLYYLLTVTPFLLALASIAVSPRFWPVAVVIASFPSAFTAVRVLRNTRDDVQDIRNKAAHAPYPLYSIRLHLRFGMLAVIGLVLAGLLHTANL